LTGGSVSVVRGTKCWWRAWAKTENKATENKAAATTIIPNLSMPFPDQGSTKQAADSIR
jgi:hypothetical protein